jgi:hypothetical protein
MDFKNSGVGTDGDKSRGMHQIMWLHPHLFFDIWLRPSNLGTTKVCNWTHSDGTKQKYGYTHRTVDISIHDQTTVWMQPPNLWTYANLLHAM